MRHVVFVKDRYFKQPSAFDLAPIRYVEYELTSDAILPFQQKIASLIQDVLISYPDEQGTPEEVNTPLRLSFQSNVDDLRIYTPPFAHRRVANGTLEFGSLGFFPHSWASIGRKRFLNFSLKFSAKFRNSIDEFSYVGVGLRSQHYWANFAHILYLTRDGRIILTQPDEYPPHFYKDLLLRDRTPINIDDFHLFQVSFDNNHLAVHIDDFSNRFDVINMLKVFGPGLIRFQSYKSWMAIKELEVKEI